MLSRILTGLIRLNHLTKLTNIEKTQSFSPAGSVIKHCLGAFQILKVQTMSTCATPEEFNDPKRHLDYYQLMESKCQENMVLIDVREHSEINDTGKIPGSIHIPLGELKMALDEMSEGEFQNRYHATKPPKDAGLIFSCKTGARSLKALKLALEMGYKNAKHYKGGWTDWTAKSNSSC